MSSMIKNGLLLCLFALFCTTLVTLTYIKTQPDIKAAALKNRYQILNQIIPEALHDNPLVERCIEIQSEQLGSKEPQQAYVATLAGEPSAIAIEATAPNGYNGRIDLIVGFTLDGLITGVRTLNHQETPGLGDKIELRKSSWVKSFSGQQVKGPDDAMWAVKKDGGKFDQFTGATITPRAYINAIKQAALYYQANREWLFNQTPNCKGASHE